MLFVFNQVPALAITSDGLLDALREFLHTAQDTPEKVDARALVQAARALKQLVLDLDASGTPEAPDTMGKGAMEETPWGAGDSA
jgi:hypothetical protein